MGIELIRKSHPKFFKEMRKLRESRVPSDRELFGKLMIMANDLLKCKREGGSHVHEEQLNGEKLKDINYLKKKRKDFSIRMYFTVTKGVLWMLALINKRRDDLEDGEEKMLKQRLREIQKGDLK